MHFLLVLVTDRQAEQNAVPDWLSEWVLIVDSSNMCDFLGPLLQRRRLAAALVAQKTLTSAPAVLDSQASDNVAKQLF